MSRHLVAKVADLPPGSRKIVQIEGSATVGVFNVSGRYYALKNVCPHQGAPICIGEMRGTGVAKPRPNRPPTMEWGREGEILACPWHHWEIEIATGKSVFPSRFRIATYDVSTVPAAELSAEDLPRVETYAVDVEDDLIILDTAKPGRGAEGSMG